MAASWTSIGAVGLIVATGGLGFVIMRAGDYLNTALAFAGSHHDRHPGLAPDACLSALLLLPAGPSRRS